MKRRMLTEEFFKRRAVDVAKDLIGKYLVRQIDGKTESFRIIETEAYEGGEDKASHARHGRTARNAPMFEKGGTMYVYFTYGMHWLLNFVCGDKNEPSGVLIRGVEGCIGPARLTKKLKIDKELNGKRLGKVAGLWVEEDITSKPLKIKRTPRIGVAYAGPVWSQKKYRFISI